MTLRVRTIILKGHFSVSYMLIMSVFSLVLCLLYSVTQKQLFPILLVSGQGKDIMMRSMKPGSFLSVAKHISYAHVSL